MKNKKIYILMLLFVLNLSTQTFAGKSTGGNAGSSSDLPSAAGFSTERVLQNAQEALVKENLQNKSVREVAMRAMSTTEEVTISLKNNEKAYITSNEAGEVLVSIPSDHKKLVKSKPTFFKKQPVVLFEALGVLYFVDLNGKRIIESIELGHTIVSDIELIELKSGYLEAIFRSEEHVHVVNITLGREIKDHIPLRVNFNNSLTKSSELNNGEKVVFIGIGDSSKTRGYNKGLFLFNLETGTLDEILEFPEEGFLRGMYEIEEAGEKKLVVAIESSLYKVSFNGSIESEHMEFHSTDSEISTRVNFAQLKDGRQVAIFGVLNYNSGESLFVVDLGSLGVLRHQYLTYNILDINVTQSASGESLLRYGTSGGTDNTLNLENWQETIVRRP